MFSHSKTRKALELEALKEFKETTCAFALVCLDGNQATGIRIEAPDIMKVFSDDAPFGRECQGYLYYYTLTPDLSIGRESAYDVKYYSAREEKTVVISLYRPGRQNNPYAKFIGLNPSHHPTTPVLGKLGGSWEVLDVADSSAIATLQVGTGAVELHVPSLRKCLEFSVENTQLPSRFGFHATGKLTTQAVNDLRTDRNYHVDFNDGVIRVLEHHESEAAAVFMPSEIHYDVKPRHSVSFHTDTGKFIDIEGVAEARNPILVDSGSSAGGKVKACPSCTFENDASWTTCEVCQEPL